MPPVLVGALLPGNLDMPVYAGDSFLFDMTISSMDPITLVQTPINVASFTFKGEIKLNTNSGTAASAAFVFVKDGSVTNLVHVSLTSTDTTVLGDLSSEFVYDIQYTQGSLIQTLVAGKILMTKQVTR